MYVSTYTATAYSTFTYVSAYGLSCRIVERRFYETWWTETLDSQWAAKLRGVREDTEKPQKGGRHVQVAPGFARGSLGGSEAPLEQIGELVLRCEHVQMTGR